MQILTYMLVVTFTLVRFICMYASNISHVHHMGLIYHTLPDFITTKESHKRDYRKSFIIMHKRLNYDFLIVMYEQIMGLIRE